MTFRDNAAKVLQAIQKMQRPLLLSHQRPDGDSLGSLLAMRSLLAGMGKQPILCVFDDIPPRYRWLTGDELAIGWDESAPSASDGVIIMDTCTYNQLAPAAAWLRDVKTDASRTIIAIDHHLTRDPLADIELVDTTAAAACVILYEWADHCGIAIDGDTARALFVGIATDTGWFRFSNTDPRALRAAAELLTKDIKPDVIYRNIYDSESAQRYSLRAAALAATEWFDDGNVGVITITADMFARTSSTPMDTEDLVNEPLKRADTEVAIFLVEQKSGGDQIVKASLRSKSKVDVAAIAQSLGGGGHARAAGVRLSGSIADAKSTLLAKLNLQQP